MNYQYPMDAIRELVVNAIIHKDYSTEQEIAIYVYKDMLKIYSGGLLPEGITFENLKGNHPSIKRNKKLAEAFYSMKYIEGWGQGISKVLSACRENGNPEPGFSYMSSGFMVILRPKGYSSKVDVQDLGLDDVDSRIIQEIIDDPSIRMKDISVHLELPVRAVRYRIDKLRDKGLVVRDGSKKAGVWKIQLP